VRERERGDLQCGWRKGSGIVRRAARAAAAAAAAAAA
jgi:hypothetical protein